MFNSIVNFTKRVAKRTVKTVSNFVKGCVQHTESVAILSLSAIGLNALAGEIPFLVPLPMWIEASMFIPVLSVIAIGLLVKSADYRASNRRVGAYT